MAKYVAALDQGTTSTRCMLFDHGGKVVSVAQKEHEQIYPKPGWVEHDAAEIWARTQEVVDEAMAVGGRERGRHRGARHHQPARDRARVGPDDRRARVQRDRLAGHAHGQAGRRARAATAARTGSAEQTGLPLATYFSGPKVRWILDNVDGVRDRAESGDLVFGNMDTWLIWNLTGGTDGGLHITDVTNASRTLLMDLKTLDWDDALCSAIGVPRAMLPEIRSSSDVYGEVKSGGALQGVQIAGDLGDQQAATFGQTCFSPGEAKNTYGTGNFLLLNTGTDLVRLQERPAHHGRLQDRRPGRRSTASRAPSPSRARSSSGCATT